MIYDLRYTIFLFIRVISEIRGYCLFLSGLSVLCGSNNSVNRCKSVSNRKLFEKTKPISRAMPGNPKY